MSRSTLVRALPMALAVLSLAGSASADRRTEAAARTALTRADDDYLKTDFAKALKRLSVAERACGEATCSADLHAALLRDMGTMELRLGHAEAAATAFRRARTLSPSIALNPDYDTKDLRLAWDAAIATAKPAVASGDFVVHPAAAQATSTPLPVYVEIESADVVLVVVKYRTDAMRSFRRAVLKKKGSGWGGYVPCADVVAGTLHYYVQGFDKDGELAASSGDPNRTFDVPIKGTLTTEPPSLPGEPAPPKCGEQAVQPLDLGEGERCTEDRQCRSGACSSGHCKAVPSFEQEDASASGIRPRARFWIGMAGSLDLTSPASASNVCAGNGGSNSGYWCTTPEGADLPANNLAAGGTSSSEVTPGGVHLLVVADYAANGNLLAGLRVGYVANAYPGDAAAAAGKTLSARIHAEARGTWVFGDEPIARSGLAPYAFASAGVARFDAPVTVMVAAQGVAGERAVHAWHVSGPAFASLGGGARYALSPRIAFSTGIAVIAALGPGAFALTVAPEMSLQYGF